MSAVPTSPSQLVNRPSIVGSIGCETSDRRVALFEQTRDSGRVVLASFRELRCYDEAVIIHADMQLPVLRKKVDPALIARFRPAMLGCFVPVDPTTPPAS